MDSEENSEETQANLYTYLGEAMLIPQLFTNRKEKESFTDWCTRAMVMVIHERDFLRSSLECTQCGKNIIESACGPTHAVVGDDPWKHTEARTPPWIPVRKKRGKGR